MCRSKVARIQLTVCAFVMLAGLFWGIFGPAIGAHFGDGGWHDGVPTYSQHHVCTWRKR